MDVVYNNYFSLGPDFDGELRTRSLHDCGDIFWISPAGEIYNYDDYECWEYKRDGPARWAKLSTGKNVRLRAKHFSGYITVFPAQWDGGSYPAQPEARLNIVDGKVKDFLVYKRGARLCQA